MSPSFKVIISLIEISLIPIKKTFDSQNQSDGPMIFKVMGLQKKNLLLRKHSILVQLRTDLLRLYFFKYAVQPG